MEGSKPNALPRLWLLVSMVSGFALFGILLFWLEEAAQLSAGPASVAAAAFSIVFLLGRVILGSHYDRIGARRFAVQLSAANISLHALLAVQQGAMTRTPSTELTITAPILILLVLCNAGAITSWGPLSLDLLGAQGKRVLPYMVTCLSMAQACGSALIGTLAASQGPSHAILPFAIIVGVANVLGAVALRKLLLAADAATGSPRKPSGQETVEVRDGTDVVSRSNLPVEHEGFGQGVLTGMAKSDACE